MYKFAGSKQKSNFWVCLCLSEDCEGSGFLQSRVYWGWESGDCNDKVFGIRVEAAAAAGAAEYQGCDSFAVEELQATTTTERVKSKAKKSRGAKQQKSVKAKTKKEKERLGIWSSKKIICILH